MYTISHNEQEFRMHFCDSISLVLKPIYCTYTVLLKKSQILHMTLNINKNYFYLYFHTY